MATSRYIFALAGDSEFIFEKKRTRKPLSTPAGKTNIFILLTTVKKVAKFIGDNKWFAIISRRMFSARAGISRP